MGMEWDLGMETPAGVYVTPSGPQNAQGTIVEQDVALGFVVDFGHRADERIRPIDVEIQHRIPLAVEVPDHKVNRHVIVVRTRHIYDRFWQADQPRCFLKGEFECREIILRFTMIFGVERNSSSCLLWR